LILFSSARFFPSIELGISCAYLHTSIAPVLFIHNYICVIYLKWRNQGVEGTAILVWILRKYVRFEVFTAVTMKDVVFWDIKPSSYFTGDITSTLQSPVG
jgi:hypothetical protein